MDEALTREQILKWRNGGATKSKFEVKLCDMALRSLQPDAAEKDWHKCIYGGVCMFACSPAECKRGKPSGDTVRVPCPICKGTGLRRVVSFVDSSKTVEKSCDACRGHGTIATTPRRIAMTKHPTPHYPTIERLADLTATTVGYQGPELVEEAVRCWRELSEAREKLGDAQKRESKHFGLRIAAELRADTAEQKLEAYQTVLNLIGERLPDCPVIGDYPGGIDLLKQKLERRDALLKRFLGEGEQRGLYADTKKELA